MTVRVPVLVVGAGPVGLALAGDLGWRGVATTLVERGDGEVSQPRMDMVGIRTMEFCRRWGIVGWVEAAGYNRQYPQDCAWVTDLNGYEFGREPFAPPKYEASPPQSPQHRERCPQNFFDPVLRRFAERSRLVDIRYGTELVSFVDRGDVVLATVRDVLSGELSEIEAEFLVGTDGGMSMVREALGIGMSGAGVLTYTTNAVFRCDGLERLHHMEPAYRYIFIGPEGTWATLVAINGRDEWRFSLVGDETKFKVSEQEMRASIVRAVGRDFEFEILSMLPWVRRELVADEYGRGRVFIAGDAAHLTSPTGGFGMNTGILDAVNLSWKLAANLEGWGGQGLLDSYGVEQQPVAVRNTRESTDNLHRMLAPRVATPDPLVFSDEGAATSRARLEYGQRYTEAMKKEWFSIGIHLGYVYEGSPVVVADGSPPPELTGMSYLPTSRPGSRAPHLWLSPGHSIIDEFGRGFVLVRLDPAAGGARLVEAALDVGMPCRILDVDSAEARRLYESALVLVRPDGTVGWRGDREPADPAEIIDAVRGSTRTLTAAGIDAMGVDA